ncbi:MAG: hypothetical protein OEZ00_03830 [Dehalococcoidia bacterium]|nr:hypothetical protein [Dehalococcoidia bacterium]
MPEKRILTVDAEVARKIDENRGEMSRSEFINVLIDSHLKEDFGRQNYVTKEEFYHSQQEMKELLRHFLEFFISYGLEVGRQPTGKIFEELNQKLQTLASSGSKAKDL